VTIPKPSFGNLFLLIVIGVLVVALFKQCPKDKEAEIEKVNAAKDSIIIKQDAEMGALIEARKREATKAWEAANETQIAIYKYDSTRKIVNALTKKALLLSGQIIDLRDALPDSNWVPVHPDYVGYCDSLADLTQSISNENTQLKIKNDLKDGAHNNEIILKDRMIQIEKGNTDIANNRFDNLNANYDAYKQKVAPRSSLLIGGEGSASVLYQQVGAIVAWQDKKGIQYQGGIGIHNKGEPYVKGGVLFTIFRFK
jgi:hypothetical protein